MKNALQEQLLKAGLATEDQMKKPVRPKRKPKQGGKNKPANKPATSPKSGSTEDVDLKAAYAQRRKQEQKEEGEKRRAAAQKKANKEKVNKLIESTMLNTDGGTVAYQFVVGKNIKKIWITEELRLQLVSGQLGITFLGGRRCVVPRATADEIAKLDPKKIVVIHTPEGDGLGAEHAVPDDLMW